MVDIHTWTEIMRINEHNNPELIVWFIQSLVPALNKLAEGFYFKILSSATLSCRLIDN